MKNRSLKGLYYFSLFSWIATICMIILSLLFPLSRLWIVGSFLCSFVQVFLLIEHYDRRVWKWRDAHSLFDRCLRALYTLLGIVFFACLSSLFIAGGGPEMVDGLRCVVDHGKVIAEDISEGWFLYLTICENVLFSFCFPLLPATFVLWRIHMLYLTGEKEDEKERLDHR